MEFARTVREARRRAGYSQAKLACLLVTSGRPEGVWSTYVGQVEKGQKVPSEEICLKLAEVLDLEPLGLLLAAHRAKAVTAAGVRFFDDLLAVVGQRDLAPLLAPARGGEAPEGLTESATELAYADVWRELLSGLCRSGHLGELAGLLQDLGRVNEDEWVRLLGFLEHPALRRPDAGL